MSDGTLKRMRRLLLTVLALLPTAAAAAQQAEPRYDKELAAFEEMDRTNPPPKGEIVFVGSSSMVDWNAAKYFPDLKIVNRALWGSAFSDTSRNVDRLILRYEPRLVVVYAGDNDLDGGASTEDVAVEFERLVKAIRDGLPQARIVFVGIKPSPQRWITIDRMRTANAMIRAICARDDRVAFVDVDGPMMGWDEKPRPELYRADGLHLSDQGYQLWTTLLRPFLVP
jgi:lysophospholipase L1-like esterase